MDISKNKYFSEIFLTGLTKNLRHYTSNSSFSSALLEKRLDLDSSPEKGQLEGLTMWCINPWIDESM